MVNLRKYLKSVTPAYWDAKERAESGVFWREAQTHTARYMDGLDRVAALPDKRRSSYQEILQAVGAAFR